MLMEFAGPGKAMFGAFAIIFPTLITGFALVVAVLFGWRYWFGMQKDEPPEPPKPLKPQAPPRPRRKPSNDNRR